MSLVIREMQIKSTVRYHFTPTSMAIIQNKTKQKKQELTRMWRNSAAPIENSLALPQLDKQNY